jgi:hypothetical protein
MALLCLFLLFFTRRGHLLFSTLLHHSGSPVPLVYIYVNYFLQQRTHAFNTYTRGTALPLVRTYTFSWASVVAACVL